MQRSRTVRLPRRVASLCVSAICLAMVALPSSTCHAAEETVPVEAAVGPQWAYGPGPLFQGVPGHFGLKIGLAAIIDQAMIRKHLNRVPKQYRAMALQMKEFRYRHSILIPDSLWISPNIAGTGMLGATWRPISLAVPLADDGVRVRIEASALLTYAFIWSETMAASTTHFLRPGVDLGLRVEIPFTESVGVAFGGAADVYLPQQPGRSVLAIPAFDSASLDRSIWLMGRAYIQLLVRFPYTTTI